MNKLTQRIYEVLQKTSELAAQVTESAGDVYLAEELTGDCAELIALFDNDHGAFDAESLDPELVRLIASLQKLQ